MRRTIGITLKLVSLAAVVQLVLGILFWTGHGYTWIPVHIVIGSILVLGLWTLSVIALVARVRPGLAVFELTWGLALAAFGMTQATILIGPMHWIVRVIHLVMAISAVRLAEMLGKAVLATPAVDDAIPMRRAS